MQIHCRHCAAEIPAANVNLDRMLAKCANCNAVFSIEGELSREEGTVRKQKKMVNVTMPQHVQVDNSLGDLKIVRKWFSAQTLPLVFFAVVWNGFMVFWFGIAFSQREYMMALCGSLHAVVGLFLIYTVATNFLNATTITVNHDMIDIKHGSIPARGNKQIDASSIAQLYCRENISRSKNSTTITYEVYAITREQRREQLVYGLTEAEQALYIEQEIEHFLGIEDRPVSGEMGTY